jgi:VWFA-related protein
MAVWTMLNGLRNRSALLLVLALVPYSALAVKRLTVEQLQQTLAAAQAAHKKDNDLVQQLAEVEAAQRISPEQLKQLIAESPGPRTTQSLRALADASAFLDPAPGEIPASPTPDVATQKAIIARTIHYVSRTLPTLPNFMATRVTEHFDDLPEVLDPGGWPVRAGLHSDGRVETQIAFRDGAETDAPALQKVNASKDAPKVAASGLNSWGEFGSILGIVLVDAAKGKLGWARWEQMDGKSVAVFRFSIDRSVSHYTVQYCCVKSTEVVDSHYGSRGGGRNGGGQGASAGMERSDTSMFHEISGYHGYFSVDPETGTVLRIVIDADLRADAPIQRAAMMVEYAPVKIGDASFVCPVRSVSISSSHEQFQPAPASPFVDMTELKVNDVSFTNYHRFGSEATVMTEEAMTPKLEGEDAAPAASAPASAGTTATSEGSAPTAAEGTAATTASAAPVAAPAPASAPKPAPSEAEAAADEEFLIRAVNGLPGFDTAPANGGAGKSSDTGFTLKTTTRYVDIGLLAYDKHNKPITDLKQDEIEIYDNGRKQNVRAFRHDAPETAQAAAPSPQAESDSFTNVTTVVREVQDAPDLLIILMDESHLAYQDLNRARGEVVRFLKATRPTSRIAVYSVSEHGFHVIQDVTQDHAQVLVKLVNWMPNAQAVSQAQALDRRIRQQFDTVHNVTDLNNVNGNFTEVPDFITTTDPELRQMGQNPLRSALEVMVALARHFSAVPGHKSMAWISGDSVLADWTDQAVGMEKSPQMLEAALMHTKEALNEAHIALYAVNASAVEAGAVDASLENRNVQLNQAAMDNAALGGSTGQARIPNAGRSTAEMQQDLHGIQGPVRQLAESTGGRAINKGGDLKATLDTIDSDSQALYDVGFDPDTAADGKFHTLTVKIPTRKDVKLRYRTGYLYSEESKSTQQRFQQAVWSPQDATGIALTATPVPASDSATGQSMIRLRVGFSSLSLEPPSANSSTPGRWTDQLYIFVAQRDDANQKAEVSGDTLRIAMKQASYETGMPAGIPYQRAVETKSKLGSIRVIVVDGNSGKMGSVTLPMSALHASTVSGEKSQ